MAKKEHINETDWLIIIANDSEIEELKVEAKNKLNQKGITSDQIKERYTEISSDAKQREAVNSAWQKQCERNQTDKFTTREKLEIFFFGPYKFFKHFDSGLKGLKESNYRIKYKQKIILLISGTIFWLLLMIGTYSYYKY